MNARISRSLAQAVVMLLTAALTMGSNFTGCAGVPMPSPQPINPFEDLEPVALDGRPHVLPATITPLGVLDEGQVIRMRVEGDGIEAVFLLADDPASSAAGRLAGGGPPREFFDYRAPVAGAYFVHVMFDPELEPGEQRAVFTGMAGDPSYRPPAAQTVLVEFEDGFLTEPGLVDPVSFTDVERQIIAGISDVVREEVLVTLRTIFADTPVIIADARDGAPPRPFSRLLISPERVLAESVAEFDSALPPVEEGSPCAVPVVFGEVLPAGTHADPGNRRLDDEAVVYVGSFQGRGAECRTAAIESLNNAVLAISHTAAHEIGHLIGLQHVALVDIMDRRPSAAFQRRLGFGRGQVLIQVPVALADGTTGVDTRVQTNIIQDPTFYFRAVFAP